MSKIAKLFRWNKKIEIKDGDKVLDTVFLRLVGDADFQEARVLSLKNSKALRIKLRNPETEEYKSVFSDIDSLTKDELIMGITFGEIPDYRDEVVMKIPDKELPPPPDNPTLEEQENRESAIEKSQEERAKALADGIEKKAEERRAELGKIDDMVKIREMYVHSVINMKCSEEFTKSFREYQVYKGTFKDAEFKELAFDSFEEFDGCAPQLKTMLLTSYVGLELTGEELKN